MAALRRIALLVAASCTSLVFLAPASAEELGPVTTSDVVEGVSACVAGIDISDVRTALLERGWVQAVADSPLGDDAFLMPVYGKKDVRVLLIDGTISNPSGCVVIGKLDGDTGLSTIQQALATQFAGRALESELGRAVVQTSKNIMQITAIGTEDRPAVRVVTLSLKDTDQ
jgi:hypothetical protein